MRQLIQRFIVSESAATSIEYALIATLVSIAIIAGAIVLGTSLNTVYTNLGTKVVNASG
jgi:pilus assembly protein Flp/PilA